MICVACGKETSVVNSRPGKRLPGVWRRRKCDNCNLIFSSREKPEFSLSTRVAKKTGKFEPFSEDKLFISINESLSHRNGALETARQLTDTVLAQLFPLKSKYLDSHEIFTKTYTVICRFDRPAATYYKAHHPLK